MMSTSSLDDAPKRRLGDETFDIEEQELQEAANKQRELLETPFSWKYVLLSFYFLAFALSALHLATHEVNAGPNEQANSTLRNAAVMNAKQVQAANNGPQGERQAVSERSLQAIVATANSIPWLQANSLYENCATGGNITRTTLLGEQTISICPATASKEEGRGIQLFSYTSTDSGLSLDILCTLGGSDCSMTGSALESPVGAECKEDIDCAGAETYCFLNVCSISNGTTYFVEQGAPDGGSGTWAGSPLNNLKETIKLLQPGDTLKLVGEFTNPSYDANYAFGSIEDELLWNFENTLTLSRVHGERGRPITITSKTGAVLKGNGNNVIRVMNSSYLRFLKLEVQGEVDNIPLSTAKALQLVYRDTDGTVKYRVDPTLNDTEIAAMTDLPILIGVKRPSYTDTRGFYASSSDHIVIQECHFHHTPGNGLRLATTEYVDVLDSEVNDCSRKSYSGTMGVTPTYIQDDIENDPAGVYRLRMLRNTVHHNYNEIWSWNPTKSFIHTTIDEGKGISCERCNTWSNGGRALFANNLVYKNGYSGLNCNDSSNLDFIGNTAYMNTYTDSVWTLEETGSKGTASRGGITFNDGTGHRMFNNIAVCDTDVEGICLGAFRDAQVEASNNLQFGIGELALKLDDNHDFSYANVATNQYQEDPKLKNPEGANFRLKYNSPALELADPSWTNIAHYDLYGKRRDIFSPDLGAIERA